MNTYNANQQVTQDEIRATKSITWLAYLGILFLIPMLTHRSSRYVKFHVNQGIVLTIFQMVLSFIATILFFIPFVGGLVILMANIANVVLFVFSIMGIVNALNGKMSKLPLIGNIVIYK